MTKHRRGGFNSPFNFNKIKYSFLISERRQLKGPSKTKIRDPFISSTM